MASRRLKVTFIACIHGLHYISIGHCFSGLYMYIPHSSMKEGRGYTNFKYTSQKSYTFFVFISWPHLTEVIDENYNIGTELSQVQLQFFYYVGSQEG